MTIFEYFKSQYDRLMTEDARTQILVRPVGSYAYIHKAWQYIFGSAAVEDMLTAGITYEQIKQAFEGGFIKDTSSSKWEHRGTKYSEVYCAIMFLDDTKGGAKCDSDDTYGNRYSHRCFGVF